MPTLKVYREKLCIVGGCGRPISPERLQLVGPTRAKTCSALCAEANKRKLRAAARRRHRFRARRRDAA